jgi:hypothetical protein
LTSLEQCSGVVQLALERLGAGGKKLFSGWIDLIVS